MSPRDFITSLVVLDMAETLHQQASQSLSCSQHEDKPSVLVCVDCLLGVCAKCVMTHKDHQVEDPNDAKILLRERFVDEIRKRQSILKLELASPSSVSEITKAEEDVKELCTRLNSVITAWQDDQLSKMGEIKTEATKREQEMNARNAKLEAILQNDTDIKTLIRHLGKNDKMDCLPLKENTYNIMTARQALLKGLSSVVTSDNLMKSKFLQAQIQKASKLATSSLRSPQQKPSSQIAEGIPDVRNDNKVSILFHNVLS